MGIGTQQRHSSMATPELYFRNRAVKVLHNGKWALHIFLPDLIQGISLLLIGQFFRNCLGVVLEPTTFCIYANIHLICCCCCCIGFSSPLRQYFSLYRAVSQREGDREERG